MKRVRKPRDEYFGGHNSEVIAIEDNAAEFNGYWFISGMNGWFNLNDAKIIRRWLNQYIAWARQKEKGK